MKTQSKRHFYIELMSVAITLLGISKRVKDAGSANSMVGRVRRPLMLAASLVLLLASRALAQTSTRYYITLADTGTGNNGDASVLVACPGKTGGNGQRNTVPSGGTVTVNGCGGSSIIPLAGTSLISCPDYVGGTNVSRYNMTSDSLVFRCRAAVKGLYGCTE